jgi:hypothetical protein
LFVIAEPAASSTAVLTKFSDAISSGRAPAARFVGDGGGDFGIGLGKCA